MRGWKTWIGGLSIMIPGALQTLGVVMDAQGGSLDLAALQGALAMFGAGLGVIGVGHKVEKEGTRIAESLALAASVTQTIARSAGGQNKPPG